MITVQELAVECGCTSDEVLTQLSVTNVFTLGPDSSVRDEDADAVRHVLLKHSPPPSDYQSTTAGDARLGDLRDKLSGSRRPSGESPYTWAGLTPFGEAVRQVTAEQPGKTKPKGKNWYPDNDPLSPLDQALADRMVPWGERSRRRTPGMIFFDELQQIKHVHKLWVQACLETGYLMSEDQIVGWLTAFPHRDLDPHEVIAVAREGVTPTDAALHRWYGRLNPQRPTVFDRVCWRDITVEDGKAKSNGTSTPDSGERSDPAVSPFDGPIACGCCYSPSPSSASSAYSAANGRNRFRLTTRALARAWSLIPTPAFGT